MNLAAIIVGALVLGAPLGYVTYQSFEPVSGSAQAAAAPDASGSPLVLRFHHDGTPIEVAFSIARVGGASIDERTLTLEDGETLFEYVVDPAGTYEAKIEATSVRPGLMGMLGIFGGQFTGSTDFDFGACDAVEVLFHTAARDDFTGLRVLGESCMPGPVHHVGVDSTGPTVRFPYPTCPLDCSMGYGFGGAGEMVFEVPEGATRIDVRAHWHAESPVTEEMRIMLTTPDDECGENCWMAVAGAEGRGRVTFTYEDPEPGTYSIWSMFTMPAGASVSQDVWIDAVVHTS